MFLKIGKKLLNEKLKLNTNLNKKDISDDDENNNNIILSQLKKKEDDKKKSCKC